MYICGVGPDLDWLVADHIYNLKKVAISRVTRCYLDQEEEEEEETRKKKQWVI